MPNHTAGGGAARRVIRLLLKSYPRSFHRQFGAGPEHALLQDYRCARASGALATARFWVRTTVSTVFHGLLERVTAGRRRAKGGARATPPGDLRVPGVEPMERLMREFGFAARRLARRPAFTLTTVGTLALGLGAPTAIFAVLDRAILRPLPYPEEDRVVLVGHRSATGSLGVPDGGYLYYAEHASTLENIAAYVESSSAVAGTGEPMELGIIQATPSLFSTLGVSPSLGRGFTPEDARPGAPPAAIVSHAFWERYFGADTASIGAALFEGSAIALVGVMPEGFDFPRPQATIVFGSRFEGPDLYLPLALDPSEARFGNFMYQSVGRLAPGVTPDEAQRELNRLMPEAAETYTGPVEGVGFTPHELREGRYSAVVSTVRAVTLGDIARVLWILFGAVGVLLLIAAANVVNLFLVRAEARRGEIAVQRALGAGRAALVRSFFAEAALVSAVGAALGVAFAWAAMRVVLLLVPGQLRGLTEVGLSTGAVAFAVGVSLIAGAGFGAVALSRARRPDVSTELASGSRGGTASRSRRRGQEALVTLQVALALVLLIGSGLLLRTSQNVRSIDPGFEPERVLTMRLSLGESLVRGAGYDDGPDDAVRSRFMIDLVRRLKELPGVEAAAFTGDLPLDGDERYDFVAVEGAVPEGLEGDAKALRVFIGPGYLDAIGAEIVSGRELEAREFADQPRSVVVNQSFAEERWPGESPLGRRLLQYWGGVDPSEDVWYTVVGVVRDIREKSLMTEPEPTVYLPTIFLPEGGFGMPVSNFVAVLRTSGPPEAMIPAVRQTVGAFHPEVPVNDVATLARVTARSFEDITFATVLLVIAGSLSAFLGLVGVYGTVAYAVGCRTREFGLRIALGATSGDVRSDVLGRAAVVGGIGIVVGLLGSAAAGRVLESLLFGVRAMDPVVGLVTAAGLLVSVVTASLVPALRAASVDPVEAMRVE